MVSPSKHSFFLSFKDNEKLNERSRENVASLNNAAREWRNSEEATENLATQVALLTTEVNDLRARVEEAVNDIEAVGEDVARDEERIEFFKTQAKEFETRLNATDLDRLSLWSTLDDLASTRDNITSLQDDVMSLIDWANALSTQNMVNYFTMTQRFFAIFAFGAFFQSLCAVAMKTIIFLSPFPDG